MHKIIKQKLHSRFINEESAPGINLTRKVQDLEKSVNKNAQKEIKEKLTDYDKSTGGKSKDSITPPKRELSSDEEDIHTYSETSGGMNDLEYDGEIGDRFKERQEMAIAGDSKMGNETYTGDWNPETGEGNGNTEPVWGASDVNFGKDLINQTKKAKKLKDDATTPMVQFGDDIELTNGKTRGSSRKVSVESTSKNNNNVSENKMKRLKFKTPFNGVEKALTLIPENYRVDNREFEMTDGNETYRIKWEGSLTEGSPVVLMGKNKNFMNEDMDKMKHLFNYKSGDTLGLVKGSARLDENKEFINVWNKTKTLLKEED